MNTKALQIIATAVVTLLALYAVWATRIVHLPPTPIAGKDVNGNDRVVLCTADRWTGNNSCFIEAAFDVDKAIREAQRKGDEVIGPYAPLRMGRDQVK
jgi:hypothetical protein